MSPEELVEKVAVKIAEAEYYPNVWEIFGAGERSEYKSRAHEIVVMCRSTALEEAARVVESAPYEKTGVVHWSASAIRSLIPQDTQERTER